MFNLDPSSDKAKRLLAAIAKSDGELTPEILELLEGLNGDEPPRGELGPAGLVHAVCKAQEQLDMFLGGMASAPASVDGEHVALAHVFAAIKAHLEDAKGLVLACDIYRNLSRSRYGRALWGLLVEYRRRVELGEAEVALQPEPWCEAHDGSAELYAVQAQDLAARHMARTEEECPCPRCTARRAVNDVELPDE